MTATPEVTQLLAESRAGDQAAIDALTPHIYKELRRLAQSYMDGERAAHTLQATALVHEAYIRLVGSETDWQDRAHFFAVAATVMRRLLVDHARARSRKKRGGDVGSLTLNESVVFSPETEPAIVELDEALDKLSARDPRAARVVELLFFGGLTYDEAAETMGISRSALFREYRFAKAWIRDELKDG